MNLLKKNAGAFLLLAVLAGLMSGCSREARRARHLAQADNYFAAGQYPQAEIEYLNVFKSDRVNAHAIGRLGTIYYEDGRLSRAYPFLVRANELDPTNSVIRLKIGFIQLLSGSVKEARATATAI